jgi:hypothetical protein
MQLLVRKQKRTKHAYSAKKKKWLRMPLFDFIFWFWVVGYSKGDVVLPW